MQMTAAVRTPATMLGNANGTKTWRSCCAGVRPIASATRRSVGSMPVSAVTALRRIGSSA